MFIHTHSLSNISKELNFDESYNKRYECCIRGVKFINTIPENQTKMSHHSTATSVVQHSWLVNFELFMMSVRLPLFTHISVF